MLAILADAPVFTVIAASDAYVRVSRVPRAELLGQPVFDIFHNSDEEPSAGLVQAVRSSFEQVIATGRPDQLPVYRYDVQRPASEGGGSDERYWSLSNTPVLDGDGRVQYLLHSVDEVTDKIRGSRRDAFLLRLHDATRPLTDPAEITSTSARMLGDHLEADRVVYCTFEPNEDNFFAISVRLRPGVPLSGGYSSLSQFGAAAAQAFRANQPCVADDAETDPNSADARSTYRLAGIRAHASVPLHKAGRLMASLGVHQITPRHWRPDEVELVQLVANRCWESIERARVEAGLRQQWHTFDTALSHTLDFIYTFDLAGRFTYANLGLLSLLQRTLDEMVGRTFFELGYPPELAAKLQRQIQQVIETRKTLRDHTPFTSPSGSTRDYEYILVPVLGASGEVDLVAGSTRDITEHHQIQERLRASVVERDTLLKEVHHRVKNNLQVIVSLLSLQSDQIQDHPAALAAFSDTQSRVRAIARIHESLYSSPDLAQVEFGQYARSLVRDLLAFSDAATDRIEVEITTEDMVLDITQAIPLGLILNELFVNCLKHAFPGGRSGTVGICLGYVTEALDPSQTLDQGKGRLLVRDNGVGLPPGSDFTRAESMGMYLVRILTRQLHGTLDLEPGLGTCFVLTFPLTLEQPEAAQ